MSELPPPNGRGEYFEGQSADPRDGRGKVGIAIVGCGLFGSKMAALIASLDNFQIVAVCDSNSASAASLASRFRVPSFASLPECLALSGAEAIALFTPNWCHREQTILAARAGKHIFCEKPMALCVEDCYDMIEEADKARICLMVGHKRRLRPQYAYMADVVRSARLGRVLTVNVTGFFERMPPSWWRRRETGGGLLCYAGVHDIDFLRVICGEAGSVYARTPVKMNHHTDFEDAISVLVHFETGPVATIQVCPFSPLHTFHEAFSLHVVLEHGAIAYDARQAAVTVQRAGEQAELKSFDNGAGFEAAYARELTGFADWVLHGTEPPLTAWDGLRCVEIMEAAELSSYSGKEVLLPLPRRKARASIFGPVSRSRELPPPILFARGLSMPEGPAFDKQGVLYVANCRSNHVSRVYPDGRVEESYVTGGKTQGITFHPDGTAFISDHLRRSILRAGPGLTVEPFCTKYRNGTPLRGPNEIAFGPNGMLYFTDPGNAWRRRSSGAFSRVLSDGSAEVLAEGLEFTNGFDFSPAEDTVYLVESTTGRILHAPLKEDGRPGAAFEELVRFEGRVGPDGIRTAKSGHLYVSLFGHGKIAIVSPDGEILDFLQLPGLYPTNCIFQGTDLLVCEGQTAAIWRIVAGEEGLPSYAQSMWQGM